MKSLSPIQSLVFLLCIGVAIAGWAYGIHWKRVASGSLFSTDEKLLISLRDQIEALEKNNASLREQLKQPPTDPEPAGEPGDGPVESGKQIEEVDVPAPSGA